MRKKITVVGSEQGGALIAQRIAEGDHADVVLVDSDECVAQATALDLNSATSIGGNEPRIIGTDFAETSGSDIVILTEQRPEESERFLATTCAAVRERSPVAVVIVATDPAESICHAVYAATEFPRQRLIGVAGIVDSARFRMQIAQEVGVSVREVNGFVLGCSGKGLVPVVSRSSVAGVPLRERLPSERIAEIVRRTRALGGHDRPESRDHAFSAAALETANSILFDQKRVLPCATLCLGEYSTDGLFVNVPVKVGGRGIEEIVEVGLDGPEADALAQSVAWLGELLSG